MVVVGDGCGQLDRPIQGHPIATDVTGYPGGDLGQHPTAGPVVEDGG